LKESGIIAITINIKHLDTHVKYEG